MLELHTSHGTVLFQLNALIPFLCKLIWSLLTTDRIYYDELYNTVTEILRK